MFKNKKILILACFVLLIFIRLYKLDADPPLWQRIGVIFDEGVWVHNARNLALFNTLIMDQLNQGLVTPILTALWYLSFKMFGTGFFSARIICALFGVLTLLLIYFFVSMTVSKKVGLVSVLLLGFNATFLVYNRLAVLETPLVFFQLLCLIFLYLGRKNGIFYFLTGIAFAISMLVKPYVLFLPVLIAIRLWEIMELPKEKRIKSLLTSFVIISFGCALVIIPYFILAVVRYFNDYRYIFSLLAQNYVTSSPLPFLYKLIDRAINLFSSDMLGQVPILILSSILLAYAIGFFADMRNNIIDYFKKINTVFVYFVIWLAVGLFAAQFSDFVDRRQALFIVPLSLLCAGIVIAVFRKSRPTQEYAPVLSEKRLCIFLLAVVISAYSVSLRFIFRDNYRLVSGRLKLVLFLFILTAFAIIFIFASKNEKFRLRVSHWMPLLLFYSFLILALSKAIYLWGFEVFGFSGNLKNAQIAFLLIFTLPFSLAIILKKIRIGFFYSRGFIFFLLISYFLINTCEISAMLIMPSFSLRDESRRIAGLIPDRASVASSFAPEVAIENRIVALHKKVCDNEDSDTDKDYREDYVLLRKDFNWQHFNCVPETEGLTYISTLKLFPSLFNKEKFKLIMELYSAPNSEYLRKGLEK